MSVGKAIRLPAHPFSRRLQKVLDLIDTLHTPKNLKTVNVTLNILIQGGAFWAYEDRGPYDIEINLTGDHLELTFIHEVGHFLEWQAIPKSERGPRDFYNDVRFQSWLDAAQDSPNVQRMIRLRDQHTEGSTAHQDLNYYLRPIELWTRAYSQYVTRKGNANDAAILFQQIAAENKKITGNITYQPFWPWDEFPPIQAAMDDIFEDLGWTR